MRNLVLALVLISTTGLVTNCVQCHDGRWISGPLHHCYR